METNRCDWMGKEWGTETYSSPNELPDGGRKKMEAKWLAGALKRKWHLLPVSGKNEIRKSVFGTDIVVNRWGESSAKTPGKGAK